MQDINTDTVAAVGLVLICFGGYQCPAAALVAIGTACVGASVWLGKNKVTEDVGS